MGLTFKQVPVIALTAVWDGGYLLGRIRPNNQGEHRFDASQGTRTMTADDLRAVADRLDDLNSRKGG